MIWFDLIWLYFILFEEPRCSLLMRTPRRTLAFWHRLISFIWSSIYRVEHPDSMHISIPIRLIAPHILSLYFITWNWRTSIFFVFGLTISSVCCFFFVIVIAFMVLFFHTLLLPQPHPLRLSLINSHTPRSLIEQDGGTEGEKTLT